MSDDIQLPELPPLPIDGWYREDDMEAYARAAVLADRERRATATVQDERADFELWAMNSLGLKPWSFERFDNGEGDYCNDYVGTMWAAWNARSSINKGNGNG